MVLLAPPSLAVQTNLPQIVHALVGDVVKSRLDELETEASELQGYILGQ